jgi:hypothetical protein
MSRWFAVDDHGLLLSPLPTCFSVERLEYELKKAFRRELVPLRPRSRSANSDS